MSKKIVIYGVNNFAKLMKFYIENHTNDEVIGFTTHSEFYDKQYLLDKKYYEFENLNDLMLKVDFYVLVAVGYKDRNHIRKKVFNEIFKKGFKIASFIHPSSVIANNIEIKLGNIILENVTIQPDSKIGSGNIIWSNVVVSHNSIIGDYNYFSPSVSISGNVNILDLNFFGNNSTVKNNITILNSNLIGAGSYVDSNLNSHETIVPHRSFILEKETTL